MEKMLNSFILNASLIQKGIFLMIAGLLFVFFVQVIFFLVIKLWPGRKQIDEEK